MREGDNFIVWGTVLVILIAILCTIFFDPVHKKNTEKFSKPKPIDRTQITSNDVTGNVESIHPWGRTEVVPIKEVKLEYFEYCDEWVMSGDVVQPVGRKDYFMPVINGHLDLNVKDVTQTWIEYGSYSTSPEKDAETYEDFRVANIRVREGEIINILYKHYRLDSNKTWSIIAAWEAIVNPDVPDKENQHE